MNLLISRFYDKNYLFQKNVTGDYNLINSFEYLINKYPDEFITYDMASFILYTHSIDSLRFFFNEIIKFTPKNIIMHMGDYSYLNKNIFSEFDVNWFLYIIDIHGEHNLKFKSNKIKLILPYAYSYNIFGLEDYEKYQLSHCIVHKVEYNDNPINQILGSGRGYKNVNRYPNRHKLFNLSLKNNNIIYFRSELGYRVNATNNDISNYCVEENFIKLLNKYKFCFCDDLISYSPYIVAKFFEIMSSGSLLVTTNKLTKKYFEKLGFIDRVDYISIDEDNMLNDINNIFNLEDDIIEKIRKNGYEKVWKNHSYISRAEELYQIINNDLKNFTFHNDGINNTNFWCFNYL
jgi:hypothetical protein